jgi:hypothetical protein
MRFFSIPLREKEPQKTSGMHRCIPDSSFRICAYLFFLAFFFAAILFSSKPSRFRASVAGGARIQSSCIVTPIYLVKKKVTFTTKKMNLRHPNPEIQKSAQTFARINPQTPPSPEQPPRARREDYGLASTEYSSADLGRCGIESFRDRAPI